MPKQRADLKLFEGTQKATFIKRVNRFVVECALKNEIIRAYLPNPGRLRELLLPGKMLYLTENPYLPERKYRYTAVAVKRDGAPVLLHTHRSNDVVRWLIETKNLPGFEDATVVKPEAKVGRSRFDFLLMKEEQPFLLEVKSCTLFGKTVAMFPDAVTERGKRHLIELADQSRKGTQTGVIFLVHWPHARWFLPDYHTDIEFARTLYEVRNEIMVKALSIGWNQDLSLTPEVGELEIPWHIVEGEACDSGSYLLILSLKKDVVIEVGKLGVLPFRKGYYLYAGSAKRNLKKRMARHMRRRKNPFWHIDYLREAADHCLSIPVRSSTPLECLMAKRLDEIADWSVPKFGSSDCRCDTHLFGMQADPLENPRFIEILQHFRIDRLETLLSA